MNKVKVVRILTLILIGILTLIGCEGPIEINLETPTSIPAYTDTPILPTPTSAPITVRLALDGSGDYPSLEAAVEAVPAGSTINLDIGTYRLEKPLDIRKSLHIVGTGRDQTEIVSEADGYVVRFSSDGLFTVEDVSFRHFRRGGRQEDEAGADVVVIEEGEVAFAHCRFAGAVTAEGKGGAGLRLTGSTTGFVQDCVTEWNDMAGILIQEQAQPTLEENSCSNNEIGILYTDNTSGIARQNRCKANENGIAVTGQAQPTLEENICSSNGIGIVYTEEAGGVARQNQCISNGLAGISIYDQAQPTLEENICSNNDFGIAVQGTANPNLKNNHCELTYF